MRGAIPIRKRGFSHLLKPLLLSLIAVAAVWAAVSLQFAGFAFSMDIGGDTAVALLRAETARQGGFGISPETFLALGSPLLAGPKGKASNGPGDLLPVQNEPPVPPVPPPSASPPYMTPSLPLEEPPPEADEPPEPSDEGWDDRVWPVPGEFDPDANPLHEVTLLPVWDEGYLTDGSVAVNNDTKFSLDVPALLAQESKIKLSSGGPQILIIHTHGSESYLPDERDFYIPTDIERTEDTRYNIVRIGDEITARLEALGLAVLHDRDIHDFPSYSGSYGRALTRIQEYMQQYPTIQVVLDVHRDSISYPDGTMFKTVCETGYGKTAQMMFVVGSSGMGLPHDNWRDNLSFAAKLQSRLLEACPTLMRPIHLRRERFNQHATPGSLILEVGTAGNSLTEALRAANLFSDVAGPYLAGLLLPEAATP